MSISIVIPAHNGERFLSQTVESVLAQTVSGWELVIVDDGSIDSTGAIARDYAARDRRIRPVSQANAGVGAARNRGLSEARPASDSIIFLDHDDLWERDALERLQRALDAHPEAVAASGLSRIIDAEGEPRDPGELEAWGRHRQGVVGNRLVPWPPGAPTTLAVLAYENCIYTPGQALIRRAALVAAGPFDAAISPCDDWDMWLRLSLLGPIAFVDRVILNWRAHDTNGSAQRAPIFQGHAYVRKKLLSSPALSDEQRRTVLAANRLWGRRVRSMRLGRARDLLAHGELRPALAQVIRWLADYRDCLRGAPVAAPAFWPTLKELYRTARDTPSDVNEHLECLRQFARSCRHVTELGTRWGVSTTALLAAGPAALVTYDRERLPSIATLERAAREANRTRFVFRQADVLDVEIGETDMLFIDTWHTYEQLSRELALHADKVRKYLIFHDTTTYGEIGEAPGHGGLWPAIEEFLAEHPEWALTARLTNNNGLTILTRAGAPDPALTSSKRPRRPAYR